MPTAEEYREGSQQMNRLAELQEEQDELPGFKDRVPLRWLRFLEIVSRLEQDRTTRSDACAMAAEVHAIAWLSQGAALALCPGLLLTRMRDCLREFHGPRDALRADVACKSCVVFREVCVCVGLCRDAFVWRKEGRRVDWRLVAVWDSSSAVDPSLTPASSSSRVWVHGVEL